MHVMQIGILLFYALMYMYLNNLQPLKSLLETAQNSQSMHRFHMLMHSSSLGKKTHSKRKKMYGLSNRFLKQSHVSKHLILARDLCNVQCLRIRL